MEIKNSKKEETSKGKRNSSMVFVKYVTNFSQLIRQNESNQKENPHVSNFIIQYKYTDFLLLSIKTAKELLIPTNDYLVPEQFGWLRRSFIYVRLSSYSPLYIGPIDKAQDKA